VRRPLLPIAIVIGLASCRACEEAPRPAAPRAASRWQAAGFGGAGRFLGVFPDPRQAGVVYATTERSGVYRSEDHGESWSPRSRGLRNLEVACFAIDPHASEVLYAGVGGSHRDRAGVHRSRDGGASWERLASSFEHGLRFRAHRTPAAIAPDPRRRGTLLAGGLAGGVFRSRDDGQSWELVLDAALAERPPPASRPAASAPATPASAPASRPVESSSRPASRPSSVLGVPAVVFDPGTRDRVFAAIAGIGVARSAAAGAPGSWRFSQRGLPKDPALKTLVVSRSGILYAVLDRAGVYRSVDGGVSFRSASDGLPLEQATVHALGVDPARPARILAAVSGPDLPGLWRSDDEAVHWAPLASRVDADRRQDPTRAWASNPMPLFTVAVDPLEPRRLWSAGRWGILRSESQGRRLRDSVAGAQVSCPVALALDGDRLLAGHEDAGLLASRDAGASWRALWPALPQDAPGHVHALAVSRAGRQSTLLAGLEPWSGGKVWLLRAGDGRRFEVALELERARGSWTDGAVTGLTVDPREPRTIYLSQDGGAVHVSRDAGASFRPTSGQPGGRSFTRALAVGPKGELLAGTYRDGLWRSRDGGKHWTRVLAEQDRIWQVAEDGRALYATSGSDGNLHRSSDGGASWSVISPRAPGARGELQAHAVAVDPRDGKHLVFSRVADEPADAGAGLLESSDGGKSWRPAGEGLPVPNVTVLLFDREGALHAGTRCAGLWRRP
jgi:photosystem II stability/assembly factor-like uncharacterized protein